MRVGYLLFELQFSHGRLLLSVSCSHFSLSTLPCVCVCQVVWSLIIDTISSSVACVQYPPAPLHRSHPHYIGHVPYSNTFKLARYGHGITRQYHLPGVSFHQFRCFGFREKVELFSPSGVSRPKLKKKKLAATDLTIHNFNIQDAEGKVIVALKEILETTRDRQW